MKRIILSTIFAFAIVVVANAIVTQKVTLKDGSVLYGYIQQQDGKGQLTIHTDSAIICINGNDVEVVKSNGGLYDIVFKPDSLFTPEELRGFKYNLRDRTKRVSGTKLLEKGAMVKYLDQLPNSYIIRWNDVVSIQSPRRLPTALSGIDRICMMKDGHTVEGQYAGETEDLQELYLADGLVQSFRINDVVKYNYRPINPNQDIFAQSELLDVIKTKMGGDITGVIVEQSYESRKDAENYFLIKTGSQTEQKVMISDIVEVRKEENPAYDAQYDIMMDEGDVYVNRQKASFIKVSEQGKNNDVLQLDSINHDIQIAQDASGQTKVPVEYRVKEGANVKLFQLVKVSKEETRKGNIFGFTYKDLAMSNYQSTEPKTSVNHTTRVEYVVSGKGVYALYDAQKGRAITFRVK